MQRKSQTSHRSGKKWVASVKTESTYPPKGLFTKSASTIARSLASKEVSPKGPASGMRMLTYYENRAGKALTPERREELEKAKRLLSARIHKDDKKSEGSKSRTAAKTRKQQ